MRRAPWRMQSQIERAALNTETCIFGFGELVKTSNLKHQPVGIDVQGQVDSRAR